MDHPPATVRHADRKPGEAFSRARDERPVVSPEVCIDGLASLHVKDGQPIKETAAPRGGQVVLIAG